MIESSSTGSRFSDDVHLIHGQHARAMRFISLCPARHLSLQNVAAGRLADNTASVLPGIGRNTSRMTSLALLSGTSRMTAPNCAKTGLIKC